MTPENKARLEEIKGNQFGRACADDSPPPKTYYETEWLISELEKAWQREEFLISECKRIGYVAALNGLEELK